MKKFFIALMVMVTSLSFVVSDAEARRMGGGGSFGKQSRSFSPKSPSQFSQNNASRGAAAPNAAGAGAARSASPWRGMLGGALLGLGLGALLSHFGIGGALASMISSVLMIALLVGAGLFIYRMLMRRKQGPGQPAYASTYSARSSHTPEIGSGLSQPAAGGFSGSQAGFGQAEASWQPQGVPADFDVPGFLRHAKTYFIRLQAAWDRADVNDIREFSTPEMFGELQMQLHERGAAANHTDVVSLEAELLGMETSDTEYLASVQFAGTIREGEQAAAEPFTEIWNLTKPISGGGWLLAGIQQVDGQKSLAH